MERPSRATPLLAVLLLAVVAGSAAFKAEEFKVRCGSLPFTIATHRLQW